MLRLRSARRSAVGAHTPADERRHERSRGQGLVEFALVIPILLLLTLTALDFGRVYLGYINLQNMARIAANFAANNPTAWDATPDAEKQLKYRNQILADAAAINCTLPVVAGVTIVPTPNFIDTNGNGLTTDLGDTAEVQMACTFGVITPGISNIVGGTVQVAAASRFPVKAGMSSTGPGAGAGSAPNAAFSGNGVITPNPVSGVVPFAVEFRDTSGGYPTQWLWTFTDDGTTTTLQDPLVHTFLVPGTWEVTMTATNMMGSDEESMWVTVTAASAVNFTVSPSTFEAGETVTFTDTSTTGGSAWDWTFGAGEGTATGTADGQSVTHTYNTPGTYSASLTVTYPSGPVTETKTINVSEGTCTVPSLHGVRFNDAEAIWQGSPNDFTGVVIRAPGAPSGNFIITAQSLVTPDLAPCNSDVTVNRP